MVVAYPRPALSAIRWKNHAPISFDQQAQVFKATRHAEIRKIGIPRSMALKASIQPSKALCIPEKCPYNHCPFVAPCYCLPSQGKTPCSQRSAFHSETPRFALLILASKGPASPWSTTMHELPSALAKYGANPSERACHGTLARVATIFQVFRDSLLVFRVPPPP